MYMCYVAESYIALYYNVLCLRNIQPILEILREHHLPASVLTVAIQLAASLILVSPNVPECHTHLSPLLKAVCDHGRTNDREEIGIVLAFFQELALKYPGYEYVRSTSICVCVHSCNMYSCSQCYHSNCTTATHVLLSVLFACCTS